MGKLKENDLVIPVLEYLRDHDGTATIRDIRDYILENFELSGEDLRMSTTRRNEHIFEQQIRNLTSHRKLSKLGLAEETDGGFRLLPGIKELLDNSSEWVVGLLSQPYSNQQVKAKISNVDRARRIVNIDETIAEGEITRASDAKRRSRSQKLRAAAIQNFRNADGTIRCRCCGMTFKERYGEELGVDCIEIHHKKPVSMYEDDDINRTIAEALNNLIPVCPNCHRVIHRNKLFSDAKLRKLMKHFNQ